MAIESGRPDAQREGAPVIEDASLPYMDRNGGPASDLMLTTDRIGAEADAGMLAPPLPVSQLEGRTQLMAPFREEEGDRDAPQGRGEQRERKVSKDRTMGYVRIRVRLENRSLSVVGVHAVEGPLVFDETLQGALAYEVRADDRRIGIGSVPDAGQMRSFPSPEPDEGQIGHHIVPLRATEFNVRVPMEDMRAIAPERLRIDVYAMKATPERQSLSPAPLHTQLGKELRLVASLDGLAPEKLDPRVREDMKRALRQN